MPDRFYYALQNGQAAVIRSAGPEKAAAGQRRVKQKRAAKSGQMSEGRKDRRRVAGATGRKRNSTRNPLRDMAAENKRDRKGVQDQP